MRPAYFLRRGISALAAVAVLATPALAEKTILEDQDLELLVQPVRGFELRISERVVPGPAQKFTRRSIPE